MRSLFFVCFLFITSLVNAQVYVLSPPYKQMPRYCPPQRRYFDYNPYIPPRNYYQPPIIVVPQPRPQLYYDYSPRYYFRIW